MKFRKCLLLLLLSTLISAEKIPTERQHALSNLAPKDKFVFRV